MNAWRDRPTLSFSLSCRSFCQTKEKQAETIKKRLKNENSIAAFMFIQRYSGVCKAHLGLLAGRSLSTSMYKYSFISIFPCRPHDNFFSATNNAPFFYALFFFSFVLFDYLFSFVLGVPTYEIYEMHGKFNQFLLVNSKWSGIQQALAVDLEFIDYQILCVQKLLRTVSITEISFQLLSHQPLSLFQIH